MKNINRAMLRLVGGTALVLFATLAQAQYVWVDAKGMRQFSDRPPPPSTPADKILKAPQKQQPVLVEPAAPSAAAAAAPAKASSQPTLAERDADFRKRAQERAKEEQKAAAEAGHKKALAENCDAARQYKAQLESGIRISKIDNGGERAFISDDERAKALASTNKALESCR
jgi:hypothetical protein